VIDSGPQLTTELEDGRLVILLGGEIDLSNAETLELQINQAISGADDIVIDLTTVEFIDSRGLRLLKRVSTTVAERDGRLTVVAAPASIARSVLDMTRMTDELSVRDARHTADA
jgi:anti-sigma B factor antagonist